MRGYSGGGQGKSEYKAGYWRQKKDIEDGIEQCQY